MMPSAPRVKACPGKVRHPCAVLGAAVGLALAAVAIAWLLVANRDLSLNRFAIDRNLAAAALMGLWMLVPVFAFLKNPPRIFFSGIIAWTILTAAYSLMSIRFNDLDSRLGIFHLFVLGALAYALAAAFVWVLHIALMARRQPLIPERRRLSTSRH
jgi:hypothetical protein